MHCIFQWLYMVDYTRIAQKKCLDMRYVCFQPNNNLFSSVNFIQHFFLQVLIDRVEKLVSLSGHVLARLHSHLPVLSVWVLTYQHWILLNMAFLKEAKFCFHYILYAPTRKHNEPSKCQLPCVCWWHTNAHLWFLKWPQCIAHSIACLTDINTWMGMAKFEEKNDLCAWRS